MAARTPRRSSSNRISGRLPSERTPDRAEAASRNPIDQYPERPKPLPDDDYRDAARYLLRRGHDDLIDVLGLTGAVA
jgi:hypothetical protein